MRIVGIGIDIVETARIEASIQRHGEDFLRRIFTGAERHYCERMRVPFPNYAARFAAKEAVSKAFILFFLSISFFKKTLSQEIN
ncbi:MAG: holo-ACP synthase [Verrucomicrobiota bacterium]